MTLIDKLQQIERVDALIRRKATGSPEDLALTIDTSERCVYDLIKLMKQMGAPIYFCNHRGSYCYKIDVVFSIGFVPLQVDKQQITGGTTSFFMSLQDFCIEYI